MVERKHIRLEIKKLFTTQKLGVLSTCGDDQPYSNLVAFAATEDLKKLIFATTRSTKKYTNLTRNPIVSLLVDNRANQDSDFSDAIAVTATGVSREVSRGKREALLKIYLKKHPHLKAFVMSPTCALLNISVHRYYLVHSFQQVLELPVRSGR